MTPEPQVAGSHYQFGRYMHKRRWASMWYQLDEVSRLQPERVLEIGPGPGLFKAVAGAFGIGVETLDIDPELRPDHVASVFELPFADGAFDVVCAFQMLEHLPFDQSLAAFREMTRVAGKAVVLSLPDAAKRRPYSLDFPGIGVVRFSIPKLRLRPPRHKSKGQHYWEINKAGYPLKRVTAELLAQGPVSLARTFRVHEHLFHRFFVFMKE